MVERRGRRDHADNAALHDTAPPEPTPAPPLGPPPVASTPPPPPRGPPPRGAPPPARPPRAPPIGAPRLGPPPETGSRKAFWRGPKVGGPLRRSSDARAFAGVAAGLARRFGLDPTCVRIAFA